MSSATICNIFLRQDPWPTRSPGIPEAPWRLSMISRKAVLELAANMKVLEKLGGACSCCDGKMISTTVGMVRLFGVVKQKLLLCLEVF